MQTMTIQDIDAVGGGMTENQCIGFFTLGGGVAGALFGGGFVGAGFGMAAGAGFGMVVCVKMI